MSNNEKYYLCAVEYEVIEHGFTEHFVIQAKSKPDAEMRLRHGLKTWYEDDGIEPDDYGVHFTGDVAYSGYVEKEVSRQFADECPHGMKMLTFGGDYQPSCEEE